MYYHNRHHSLTHARARAHAVANALYHTNNFIAVELKSNCYIYQLYAAKMQHSVLSLSMSRLCLVAGVAFHKMALDLFTTIVCVCVCVQKTLVRLVTTITITRRCRQHQPSSLFMLITTSIFRHLRRTRPSHSQIDERNGILSNYALCSWILHKIL